MSPRYKTKSATQLRGERKRRLTEYEDHAVEMNKLERSEAHALEEALPTAPLERAKATLREARTRPSYGPDSEHSWVRDSALASMRVPDVNAVDRLARHREAMREERAVGTSLLGGIVPATIPPYVAEAVAYGVRSGAPLASALERLDLPPVGVNVAWAKVTTGATVTNQTAENAALTGSHPRPIRCGRSALTPTSQHRRRSCPVAGGIGSSARSSAAPSPPAWSSRCGRALAHPVS
jgi:hypothetical protein